VFALALSSVRSILDLAVAHHDQNAAMAALGAEAMGSSLWAAEHAARPPRRAAG